MTHGVFAASCASSQQLSAPVSAPVVETFREPACAWCAGKRGIEYATPPGTTVRAGVTGTISFSGLVGGVRYVVVQTSDGALVTHGKLTEALVHGGAAVHSGDPIGLSGNRLYFGLRIMGRYFDPMQCLAGAGSVRPRAILVPSSR